MTYNIAHYTDVPDFIYGITREIWEDRGIGEKLQKYYAADCLVRAATGLAADNLDVTAQTLQTLHQFPDRQLVGFARVPLPVGASRRVTFTLHPSRLAFFDDSFDFVCEPGAVRLEVGGCAGRPERTATIDLDGEVQAYRQVQVVATAVQVTEV